MFPEGGFNIGELMDENEGVEVDPSGTKELVMNGEDLEEFEVEDA